ncbi:MAG: hypothetical protein H6815_06450 [Phycisphaeraceae bacterium]|nr:hypothetical protein [Phycisphaerales bacterium]MCB9860080.1 hypothetical protein [Phycisphaeraceae bacterium]
MTKVLIRQLFLLTPIVLLGGCTTTHKSGGTNDAPSLTPLAAGVALSSKITHEFFPLSFVRYIELASETERSVRRVEDRTHVVGGVECLVLAEESYEDGELAEISYNYFAQDGHGNVYYFGEDVDNYKDGVVVDHGGSWLVGRNASEPTIFLPSNPQVGYTFKPENSPPDAEEWAEVQSVQHHVNTPFATYDHVLAIRESNNPDEWQETKYYARGIGLIAENDDLLLTKIGRD